MTSPPRSRLLKNGEPAASFSVNTPWVDSSSRLDPRCCDNWRIPRGLRGLCFVCCFASKIIPTLYSYSVSNAILDAFEM
jgi:hypothetical protein